MSEAFVPTLVAWQWAILAAIPLLIVLLYFLKLKRRPLEVPSTYLWRRTVEDLHVNAIWQRLRQNLLLFLQLLFIALVAFALLRPGWQGMNLQADRLIFLVDTSASMSANDVGTSRLDEAKRECAARIDAMDDSAVAMIISFSDAARVEQIFTDNKHVLRNKLNAIAPTTHRSNLDEALRAASGLANPGRTGDAADGDVPAANPLPATLYVFSDGGFATIPNFALGTLEPRYVKIGDEAASNVAITAFSTERHLDRPGRVQAFGRVENHGRERVVAQASLFIDDELVDAQELTVPARETDIGVAGVQFEFGDRAAGELRLELELSDALAIDNVAYAVLDSPRPARVLLVTPGESSALRLALSTDEAEKISQVTVVAPSHLETKGYHDEALAGTYDLIIYDRCAPKTAPQSNTLFIGRVPLYGDWPPLEKQGSPLVIDIDRAHPLTQLIDMSNVLIVETSVVKPPPGGTSLIDADVGPIFSIGPRQSYEDAVLGFEIAATADDGGERPVTDWPRRRSFPVFVMNVVKYLGGVGSQGDTVGGRPGQTYPIRTLLPVDTVNVKLPSGRVVEVRRENRNVINFSDTHELGIYEVREGSGTKLSQKFPVNLFDSRESDLQPAPVLPIGHAEVDAERVSASEAARKELWKGILLLGLGIVLLEWYVYNRRVYL